MVMSKVHGIKPYLPSSGLLISFVVVSKNALHDGDRFTVLYNWNLRGLHGIIPYNIRLYYTTVRVHLN